MTLREANSVCLVNPSRALHVVLLALVVWVAAGRTGVAADSSSPTYALAVWAAEKGLPPGDVFAITQDLDGYLWLGTPTGLLRFDGSRYSRSQSGHMLNPAMVVSGRS